MIKVMELWCKVWGHKEEREDTIDMSTGEFGIIRRCTRCDWVDFEGNGHYEPNTVKTVIRTKIDKAISIVKHTVEDDQIKDMIVDELSDASGLVDKIQT